MTPRDTTKAAVLRELRRWHLGNEAPSPLPADALPVLLAPFRDPSRVRHDYPLVLEHRDDGLSARPLGELLPEWAAAGKAQPRVLRDNLARLERRVRLMLREQPTACARELLQAAGEQMLAELQLQDQVVVGVRADLASMLQSMPDCELLALQASTVLHLLLAIARPGAAAARTRFAARVRRQADVLRALLTVEAQKDPAAPRDVQLQKSLGGAATRFLDPTALARSVGQPRGSAPTSPLRRARLERALAALERHLADEPMPELVLVHRDDVPAPDRAHCHRGDDVCAVAMAQFERFAAALLPVVRAAYVADLEQRAAYDADRHDAVIEAMGVRDLSDDELHTLPVVVACGSARALAGRELPSLARLLTSGLPVQVLVQEDPACDPLAGPDQGGASATHARLELGYVGVAFREAYVQQTTASRPGHLLQGLQCALRGTRPGLHVVDSGLDADGREPPLGAFLYAGAAIEGRAHPLFHYDPAAGETWARRLDFAGNPAPEADWPTSALPDGRELAFTFADYALLDPHLRAAFRAVPDELASDELVPLADYLGLLPDDARHRIPFVSFVVAKHTQPQRAAVQRPLVDACRDRLRFWRTLQELAGVRNEHVREAVQRARQEAAEQATREREQLAAQHGEELERVRAEATGEAMQALARMLLELDPAGESPLPRAAAQRPAVDSGDAIPPAPPAEPQSHAPAAVVEHGQPEDDDDDDDDVPDEPWIESARCSTCNDCVNINSLLFVYNENKQAQIGDPRAGTYAQIVQAAEKCPSRCIHPGKPLNPDEPDLEQLVARAAPFN